MARRVAAVVVVLALAALISFLLWLPADPPAAPTPVAPAAVLEPVPPVVVAPQPEDEPPVLLLDAGMDAGSPRATGVVTIALMRDEQPVVGPRLALRNAQGEAASRPTDVMGLATFELPQGSWLVMAPEEVAGHPIEVTGEPSRVTLTLPPLRRVEGEVLDETGAPVPSRIVTARRPQVSTPDLRSDVEPPEDRREVARTDDAGRFSFITTEESLELEVLRGTSRARKQIAPPVSDVKLVLEQLVVLTVVSPLQGLVLLSVSSRRETSQHQFSGTRELRVPVGELDVRGLLSIRGQLLRTAHHVVVQAEQPNVLRLAFSPVPPVSGLVRDPRGDRRGRA